MDTKSDFKGWNKTVESWGRNYKTAKTLINTHKPLLYKIIIFADKNIAIDHYINIFNIIFHLKNTSLTAKNFFENDQVSFGTFTKEVAEQKIHSIIDYGLKKGLVFKCKIVKDDEYVIKKS